MAYDLNMRKQHPTTRAFSGGLEAFAPYTLVFRPSARFHKSVEAKHPAPHRRRTTGSQIFQSHGLSSTIQILRGDGPGLF